jgi:hypothetical protein
MSPKLGVRRFLAANASRNAVRNCYSVNKSFQCLLTEITIFPAIIQTGNYSKT